MRLQSKKSNNTSFPPVIITVFLVSLIYWAYLSLTTRMEIIYDSVNYEGLGRLIQHQGWIAYLTSGPNREPFYPFLVANSMQIEHLTGLAYVKVMAILGVILLCATQLLTYKLFCRLNVRTSLCALLLLYSAFSPALNNAAFSLYSEIAVFPIVLGVLLSSTHLWEAIVNDQQRRAVGYGILLGTLFTLATLTKAVFECICPAFVIVLFLAVSLKNKSKNTATLFLCLTAVLSFYYVPITAYKSLTQHYNGNFVITNRASWALYGNTARRMEPLTFKGFAEAMAYVPGEGVCKSLFDPTSCDFWSYRRSDTLGFAQEKQLINQHLSPGEVNSRLLNASAQAALGNPFQYTLLTFVEGLKMFFWESTQIGFVQYPPWLERIYAVKMVNNGLRFLMSLLSLIAVANLFFHINDNNRSHLNLILGLMIFLYILFFSFFFILTRYALPIAPLFLIAIGLWLDQKLIPKNKN